MRRSYLPWVLAVSGVGVAFLIALRFNWAEQSTPSSVSPRETATPTGPPQTGRSDGAVSALATADDGVVIDESHYFANFTYLETENRVYAGSTYRQAGRNDLPAADLLQRRQFYVAPLPEIDYDAFRTAFKNPLPLPPVKPASDELKLVTLSVPLLSAERRAVAATAVNRLHSANLSPQVNVALLPYRSVRVSLLTPGGPRVVGVCSDGEVRDHRLRLQLVGTQAELNAMLQDPRLECEFTTGGYRLKQNVLTVSLDTFVRQGFHHFLTGRADFESWKKTQFASGSVGFGIGPLFIRTSPSGGEAKAGLKNAVSRKQVVEVAQAATQYMTITGWVEYPSMEPAGAPKLGEQMALQLLTRATTIRTDIKTELEKKTGDTIDVVIKGDLSPDVLAQLGQELKQRNKTELKLNVPGPAAGGATDGGKGVAEPVVEEKRDSEDDITWDTKDVGGTKVIVPKTVRVYQFSDLAFADLFRYTQSDIQATAYAAGRPRAVPVLFTRRSLGRQEVRRITETVRRRAADGKELKLKGDGKMDTSSGKVLVDFKTATSSTPTEIQLKVTFTAKRTDDGDAEFSGVETFVFKIADGERVVRLNGERELAYKQEARFEVRPPRPPGPGPGLLPVAPGVYATELRFAPDAAKGPTFFSLTRVNHTDTKSEGTLDLGGSHLRSFTLYIDDPDHRNNKDGRVSRAVGYDLQLDIPYLVELEANRVDRVEPLNEHHLLGRSEKLK
jgi:hypothetical protein